MTDTPFRPGRWFIFLGLMAGGFAEMRTALGEDDPWVVMPGVVRGQSPMGTSPFAPITHTTVFPPQRYVSSQTIIAQNPADPYAAPPYGTPMDPGTPTYGPPMLSDPGLGAPFMPMPAVWQPYVAAQGKGGTENVGGFGQLMMPLYQDGQSLLFADIRGRFDDQSNSEGNFGLAVRTMVDPNWFVGINGFYDHKRTENGNGFNQGTIGIEAMSVQYEARMNGYIPESGAKKANDASTTQFEGGTIFVKGGLERAYYGLDGEIGALFWSDWLGSKELRGFVGGYWFDTSDKSFPSVAGPKGRLEFRWYDLSWFGPQSRLTIGVEVQYDDVRDTQVAGLARLEIPLFAFGGTRRLTRLERRMLDRIVRDDDIITVTGQGPREVGLDSLTKRPLINVQLVDKDTAGGIPGAIAAAGANGTVVVDGSKGALSTPGLITPLAGQVLRGGGFLAIGSQTGESAIFGARPTINSTNNANSTILLNNNFVTIADLNLVAGSRGIDSVGQNLTGVLVSGNRVTRTANGAFVFGGLSATSVVQNNTAQFAGFPTGGAVNNAADGFGFNNTFSGVLKGNVASNNADAGYQFATTIDATGRVTGNQATNNVRNGFQFDQAVAGTVSNNISSSNGRNATGAIITPNVGDGFRFSGAVTGTINNNTASNNAFRGFEFFADLDPAGKVIGNSAIQNFNNGFFFNTTVDAGSEVSGNIARRNGFNLDGTANAAGIDGFVFNNVAAVATGAVSGVVRDNVSEDNQQAGFFINGLSGSAINNTATNNPFGGFVFNGNVTATGVVDKNTATGSNLAANGYGFDFRTANLQNGARVTENTASFNRNGFGIGANAAGSLVNGNAASFNGFNANGTVFDANGNGFEWVTGGPPRVNNATVTNNFALGNANNGFSGDDDNTVVGNAAFLNNLSNSNGGKGYNTAAPTPVDNNRGSGNVGGGNTP